MHCLTRCHPDSHQACEEGWIVKRALWSLALAMAMTAGVAHVSLSASASELQSAVSSPTLESLLGKEVATLREGDNGRVIDLLIDGQGRVRAAVVEFGGFLGIGARKVAVDWGAFRFAGKSIWVNVTREQLRTAVEYKANEAPFIVEAISADY
jgi:PRC-barrel domain